MRLFPSARKPRSTSPSAHRDWERQRDGQRATKDKPKKAAPSRKQPRGEVRPRCATIRCGDDSLAAGRRLGTCLLAVAPWAPARSTSKDHASSTTARGAPRRRPPPTLGGRRGWRLVAGGLSRGRAPDASAISTPHEQEQAHTGLGGRPPRTRAGSRSPTPMTAAPSFHSPTVSPSRRPPPNATWGYPARCAALGFPVPDLPSAHAPALCAIGVVASTRHIPRKSYEPAVTAIDRFGVAWQWETHYATLHTARGSRLRRDQCSPLPTQAPRVQLFQRK